jgi:hypothetical protein
LCVEAKGELSTSARHLKRRKEKRREEKRREDWHTR